jgi:hypothetical protein
MVRKTKLFNSVNTKDQYNAFILQKIVNVNAMELLTHVWLLKYQNTLLPN